MTAFRRRTAFAAPVIITVAAGCSSSKEPPKEKRFSGETWQVAMRDMKCYATEPGSNPPAPREIECPPGMSGHNVITVGTVGEGTCAIVPRGCTDAACAKIHTPCPLPYGKVVVHALANLWKIEKHGELCHAEPTGDDCPPGADCNPPKPRQFPCPPGVDDNHERIVAEMPDATCVVVPEGCTNTGCATEKTDCPPH